MANFEQTHMIRQFKLEFDSAEREAGKKKKKKKTGSSLDNGTRSNIIDTPVINHAVISITSISV